MIDSPELRIAHLYRRAGFGLTRAELAKAVERGFDACVDELLHPEKVDDPLEDRLKELEGELFDLTVLEDAQAWWLYRMRHTRRPLSEKLTLFWHGHFATGASKVERAAWMVAQNRMLRTRALGRFEDLLTDVARDPAMLVWLDNTQSTKARPNENWARELLELFTLGIGNYAESDVAEIARAFTGWKQRDGAFVFDAKDHDTGTRTILGQTFAWSGEDVLRALAHHPATARRIAEKLVRFFVADQGVPALEERLARRFTETSGDVRAVMETLLRSPEFVSDDALRAKVKSPAEFVVGAMRELDSGVPLRSLTPLMTRMGQALFNPPAVDGWAGGLAWITTATLFERANFANHLATQRGITGDGRFEPGEWVGKQDDGHAVVERFCAALLDGRASELLKGELEAYLRSKDKNGKLVDFKPTPSSLDEKVRGVVRLIVASPEYQLA